MNFKDFLLTRAGLKRKYPIGNMIGRLGSVLALCLALPLEGQAAVRAVVVRVSPGPVLVLPITPHLVDLRATGLMPNLSPSFPNMSLALPSMPNAVRLPAVVAEPRAERKRAQTALESARVLKGGRARKAAVPSRFSSVYDGYGRAPAPAVRAVRSEFPHAEYLSETEGKTGSELVDVLHEITGRGAEMSSYEKAREYLFSKADNAAVRGVRGVIAAYSQVFVKGRSGDGKNYKENGDESGDGHVDSEGMNIEHLWPQSFFRSRQPMRADLHHMLPVFVYPNSIRSRFPIGEVAEGKVNYRNRAGAKLGGGVFEPPGGAKGRIVRSLLYFFVRYHNRKILPRGRMNRFWNSRIKTYLRWNREFPPTPAEKRRNAKVEAHQGNRNPFVDDPSLADRIGADAFRMGMKKGEGYARRVVRKGS